ncbi:ABC transporter substrate-binding protein [Streptomyces hoynatensis]|uniref:ABC transporter substrate-binding protein n=1 Tax=Streptomyces hoynatensis TaxID=1141874 RepID=A0A3A9YL92_9ACTN|nr:ABC transporter substrate-binding protein [Streptomyces hoynatensis]RKN37092.1 ABC transporter substrate-binding protein [Streptomyces hoynatensis]
MRLAVPDLVSNSYFPAIAAVELGYLRDEGLDVTLDLLFPVTDAATALREGRIDFLAGAAHAPLYAAAEGWGELRLLAALARNTYWFLVVRADSPLERGKWRALREARVGAAPGPDLALRHLLDAAGVDRARAGIEIAPVPGTAGAGVSFGVTAADALERGLIDAFWANGMGAEVAVRRGVGKVLLDARRDGGPAASFTFPALMTTRRLTEENPAAAAAAVRATIRAQEALRADPGLATEVGERLFPAMEAGLIAELIRRDLPFYEPSIGPGTIEGLTSFARGAGLLAPGVEVPYETAVATAFCPPAPPDPSA